MIEFGSTAQAKTDAESLLSNVNYYESLIEELNDAMTKISANWKGNSSDIADIQTHIHEVSINFNTKIIPAMKQLGTGIKIFADNVEKIASEKSEATESSKSSDKGFFGSIGDSLSSTVSDIANNWDYSECDGVGDYIGTTVTSIGKTAGDVVEGAWDLTGSAISGAWNVVSDAAGTLISGIFS